MTCCADDVYSKFVADVPTSPPTETAQIEYQYGCIDSNVSLRWTPSIGSRRIDYYLVTYDGQSHAVMNGTSDQITAVPYNENFTIQVAAVNCAGSSVPSNFTIAIGIYQINHNYNIST